MDSKDMLSQIKDVPNKGLEDLERLKSAQEPIVMYGAGSYARDVATLLDAHGITLDACCVDAEYVKDSQPFRGKTPVISVEEAYEKYPKFNLVIGFADYVKARQTLEAYGSNAQLMFFDAPDRIDFFDYAFVRDNQAAFEAAYESLADDESREIFIAFVNAKISGDPSPLYPHTKFNQYFPDVLQFGQHESFVDCGAYDGDTIRDFVKATSGVYDKVFALEPDVENYERLLKNTKQEKWQNIEPYCLGAWSEKTTLHFSGSGTVTSTVTDDGPVSIDVDLIDDIVGDEPVTFIKMDIEGSELGALKGAAKTIARDKPKLAICVYHTKEDLITIPQYIKSLNPDYKFYLREHQYVSWDMVLYAT